MALSSIVWGQQAAKGKSWGERERERERDVGSLGLGEGDWWERWGSVSK